MNTLWQKAFRDFWRERTRTLLVVIAIALGISAFQAVLSSYAILKRELNDGYLATNPASAIFRTDKADPELLRAILTNPAVSDAEARRTVSGRIKSGPVEWRNLVLFVVEDYGKIRVSKLVPEKGAWPPATGEILIERDAFQVAHTKIGDTVTVKIARGDELPLSVSGSVHDVGQAQARMENSVYGYINLETLARLGEQPYLDQVLILVANDAANDRYNEQHIRDVAADVKKLIEDRGHTVRRVDIPPPGKHPHADIMGLLLLAISSFGLFVLVLSGILVVNLLTAIMASQIRQIGMMKAIGGSRSKIAQIYFGQALLLGAAAVLVSLPAGNWGCRVLCRYMAVFLNFDITSFSVPIWVYLLVALVGVVVPILAAAYPVWKGTGVTVHQALAESGVARNIFGVSAFDRALASLGGLGRPVLLAIRNSFRRRARLALTLVTLAVGGLFLMSALNVRASLIQTLDHLFNGRKYDLSVGLAGMYPFEKVQRAVSKTPGVRRVEGWIGTEASLATPAEEAAKLQPAPSGGVHSPGAGLHGGGASDGRDRFPVVAIPAGTEMLQMEMAAGRALQPGDSDAIVINSALAAKYPRMKVGAVVALRMGPAQLSWNIVGIAREAFSPPVAYIPLSFLEQRGGHYGMANNIRLTLDKNDPASIAQVRAALDRALAQEHVNATSSTSKADGRYAFDEHMVMIYIFLIIMSCIIGGVGGLGLMTTMSLNVLERRREMGVLRTIGASPRAIWLIVVVEGLVITTLSWALGALAAWPVSKAVGNALVFAMFHSGLDFVFEIRGLWIWLAVSLLLGAAASFLPAWHAARSPIREAIGYE